MPSLEPSRMICLPLQDETEEVWPRLGECSIPRQNRRVAVEWSEHVSELMEGLTENLCRKWLDVARIETLQREIAVLKERCDKLEQQSPLLVPIESLVPEPYEVLKVFPVVVQVQGDQYIATFFDANISASGDNQTEAVFNLKDMIVGTYEILNSMNEEDLGPGPAHQRKVLSEYIREKR